MKRHSGIWVLLLGAFTLACLFMIWDPRGNKLKLRLGLDLKSGSHIAVRLVEAPNPLTGETVKITQRVQEQAVLVFQKRLNPDGTKEIVVTPEPPDRLIVEIPEETDLQKAEDLVRQAARLEIKEPRFDPVTKETTWKTAMDGTGITGAHAQPSTDGQTWEVVFNLNRTASKQFGELTRRLVGRQMGIYFDGREVMSANVEEPITGGSCRITKIHGGPDPFHEGKTRTAVEEATDLANLLSAGSLPVDVKILESYTVSPTLGAQSLQYSLTAGAMGLGFVCLYMIGYYKLPGFTASVALVIYTVICLASMNIPGLEFVLTLPGIAGFILSIGMAVDANVLIFERLKEELWEGKPVAQAISIGFEKAWPSILDGHVTTGFGAFILYIFGSATIRGFGLTLLVGTIWSLITATMFTRTLIDFAFYNLKVQDRKTFGA
ncbi:MAG: protein translocase subunit SecD [Candidatus Eremiobacteraeota bacterium]|nr:protein translocase subunit SecD [Candidatus Eremiobacteraeota bacterium]MCW5871363.1 protein translocase subunit SecD [Candidatus Eremiobacteraeota bacterium]